MKSLASLGVIAALVLITSPAFAGPAVCPKAAEELPELLASALQRDGREGEMQVSFEVDAEGLVRGIALEGPRPYQSRVRSALESMECSAGTPQRYTLKIRFAAPKRPSAVTLAANTEATGKPR